MQLVKKTKKLRNGPISLQKIFEPNPCMHARATAVCVHAHKNKNVNKKSLEIK